MKPSQHTKRGIALIPALLLVLLGPLASGRAQTNPPPGFRWATRAGGSSTDRANAVAVDTNGNAYVTGVFAGTATFGATNLISNGEIDIFVGKYDSQGHLLWVRQAGGGGYDAGYGIAVDISGNVFVTGSFGSTANFGQTNLTATAGSQDIFVAKYDNAGSLMWARNAGGDSDDYGWAITVDAAGNAYLAGGFKNTGTFGTNALQATGLEDLFVAKCDSAGNFIWARRGGNGYYNEARGIAVDAAGRTYITGEVGVGGSSIGMFAAKYDSSGNNVWSRLLAAGVGQGVAVDNAGNCYVTGAQTAKFDNAGNGIWTNQTSGNCVAISTLGHVLITGDQTLREYDAAGNLLWSQPITAFGRGWAISPRGHSVVVGSFSSTAAFGTNSLVSAGDADAFLAAVTGEVGFTVEPTDQAVQPGSNVTFTASAFGTPPLFYQWFFNNTNLLPNQTNASLLLTNVALSQFGYYSLLVSNIFGSLMSSNATLTGLGLGDDDHDGIPNYWEQQYGLNPNSLDAATYPPAENLPNRLTYLQKYLYGLNPLTNDTDGDGVTDYQELFVYGTNPLLADTDTDGIRDDWEVQHGLNPRFNDSADDLDGDGLSNLTEYIWSLSHTNQLIDPRTKYSTSVSTSDYAVVTGAGTNQFFYDRNDRLVGAEYDRGLVLAYVYDGNDNLTRQVAMMHDANTNGLPDLWEFLNGLTNNAGAYTDTDGDGWTDFQEWKSGTEPTNITSAPNLLGNPGTHIATLTLPFTPSNFVVGVGQLDGLGAEEIVIGADGDPGSTTNFLLVLTQGPTSWSTQRLDVGPFGITSISVGRLTNRPSVGIYVGLRGTTNGSGRVMEFTSNGGLWQSNVVALATNQAAFVLGMRGQDVLVSLATTNMPDGSLSMVKFSTNWNLSLVDTDTSHRGLGTLFQSQQQPTSISALRLFDSGGVAFGATSSANPVSYWKLDELSGNASDSVGSNLLTNNSVVTYSAGKINNGANFNGSSFFTGGDTGFPTGNGAFSISAWVNIVNNSDHRSILGWGTRANYENREFSIVTTGKLWVNIFNEGKGSITTVPTGGWHHVGVTYDGTTLRFYLDGSAVETAAFVNTPNTVLSGTSWIGVNSDGSLQKMLGQVDEVGIWSRALTAGEVSLLYGNSFGLGFSPSSLLLPEPLATRTNNWRGTSLASGPLRGTNGSSIFYTFADDKNANGTIDFADDFVTAEYLVSGTNASLLTLSRQPIAALTPAQSYGLASVNFLNSSNEVFFTGEPDGQVFVWTATGTTNPLQRQLFSGHHAGKAWHAMSGVKTLEPGEGLIGLRVDPASLTNCDLIFWAPQSQLPQLATLPNTAPAAAVLPTPNAGGNPASVSIRIWDAEGNASTPFLQYQVAGSSNWSNATITRLDGAGYSPSLKTAAAPTGSVHTLVWDTGVDLDAGITTNVMLRVRALDVTLLGEWSTGTPFHVDTTTPANPDSDSDGIPDSWEIQYFGSTNANPNLDPDDDGATTGAEYIANTNPTNKLSVLQVSISLISGGAKIDWLGGMEATQYLQRTFSLSNANEVWIDIQTSTPPTPISGSYTDLFGTNVMQFYRIKATR